MILRARFVLPVARPPIENGAVRVAGHHIAEVGPWTRLDKGRRPEVTDLGEVMLLPGLVNAHSHLDYTHLAGKVPPPKRFADWLKGMVALKAPMIREDFARSWRAGADMLLRTGTTTVADIEAIPDLLPEIWSATPLRVISFREIISLKSDPAAREAVQRAVREQAALPDANRRAGLSPHAPYTTTAELLTLAARAAQQHRWPLATHVAESEEEMEMFLYRHGPLYAWLKSQRDMADCGRGSPVQHLARVGYLSHRLLAVHVNHLWRDDAATLGRRRVSVVHCPRSHAYFRHLRFPREELAAQGVNLCLGTDSLASVPKPRRGLPELNLFAEMAALAGAAPELGPAAILKMATVNGAKALGREGQIGQLTPEAQADLIAIPYSGQAADLYEAAIHHSGPVSASMIDGAWAIPPNSLA